MTQIDDRPAAGHTGDDPFTRLEGLLAQHPVEADTGGAGLLMGNDGGTLRVADLHALLAAARASTELEAENAALRTATAPKQRTGQLLAATRRERDLMRDTLVEVEELAARHRRGDPYGVQGAAAQQILDVLAAGPTAGLRAEIAATALEAAAEELLGHASDDDDPQAIAATWLLQQATEVRAGAHRA